MLMSQSFKKLFTDEHVIIQNSEDKLQFPVCRYSLPVLVNYDLKI